MRYAVSAIGLASVVLSTLSGCASSGADPAPVKQSAGAIVKGEVAYTDVLRYDYTGNGKRNRIRFWMAFDGHAAKGTPGTPGYQPASGSMRYFLRDEDDGTKVMKWRQGLDMAGAPKDAPVPMTDIVFDGKTVTFEAYGMRWSITDGGDDYRSDKITVNDGFRAAEMVTRLYAGNLWVGTAR